MRRYVIELLGTFFVVLAVSLTENPLAIGLMYLSMLYLGARISGAHYNPAITQAMWLRGRFPTNGAPWAWVIILGYVGAQFLGALAAIALEFHLSGSLFVPDISPEDNIWFICLLEVLFTFVLCYIYLVVFTSHAFKGSQLYGLILGFTLVGLASMGGLFNPAIGAAALALNVAFSETVAQVGPNVLVYIVCPLVGSALAGFAYDYLEAPARGQFASVDTA